MEMDETWTQLQQPKRWGSRSRSRRRSEDAAEAGKAAEKQVDGLRMVWVRWTAVGLAMLLWILYLPEGGSAAAVARDPVARDFVAGRHGKADDGMRQDQAATNQRATDDLIVSGSSSGCPNDCAWLHPTRHTDAFVYPVARLASRQPFPSNQRDLGGVTAAIMSIDTSLTEVEGSGSEICSPDDEDCDVFSGSGLAAEDVVKSSAVVTSAAAVVSADDIVYVHRSTAEDNAGGFQSSSFSSTSSSSSFPLSPLSTTFTSSSTQSSFPPASAAPETPFPSTLSSSYFSSTGTSALNASSDDRKSGLTRLRTIPVMTKPSGVSTVDAPTTATVTLSPPDASVEMVYSTGEKEPTPPRAPLEPVYSPPDPRYGMIDQLTMNIGLILGIAIALVLLLAMLAFVLFQYRTSKEGNQTKTPGDVKVPPPYGSNTKQPMSAACRIDTTQPSADKKLSPIKTAAENNVTCSSRRKDVKEWYV